MEVVRGTYLRREPYVTRNPRLENDKRFTLKAGVGLALFSVAVIGALSLYSQYTNPQKDAARTFRSKFPLCEKPTRTYVFRDGNKLFEAKKGEPVTLKGESYVVLGETQLNSEKCPHETCAAVALQSEKGISVHTSAEGTLYSWRCD